MPGPKAKEWVARDQRSLSPSLTRPYPAVIAAGEGSWVTDVDGNRLLDMTAGIAVCATGHSHPAVAKAIQEQAGHLVHMSGADFYYPQLVQLAEKLAAIAPTGTENRVFLCNSGTEAIEASIKLAKWATRRPYLLGFYGAFHGRTMGSLSLTSSKPVQRQRFGPFLPAYHTPYPYCYRCVFNQKWPECGLACIDFIEDVIFQTVLPADEVAAIVIEPIQGEGGYIMPPQDYFPRLRALADKHGILLAVDEVQTGMGRTGKWWAIEHTAVRPDIVAVGKGIASGMPLGAMLASSSLMTWPPGTHASTFGGNPVCCAAAVATLDLIEGGMKENAATVGGFMFKVLNEMKERHPTMGDVRGRGLMAGIEFVTDKLSKKRNPQTRNAVVQGCFEHGVLVLGAGNNAVRFCPPLNITQDEVAVGLEIFEEVLTEAERNPPREQGRGRQ